MNLNFKTTFPWPGADGIYPAPTFFMDKILLSLDQHPGDDAARTLAPLIGPAPKIHTIRRINGEKARFREGMKLSMSTGSRFKPERFAEAVCTGTQEVLMEMVRLREFGFELDVWVDGRYIHRLDRGTLATNDGLTEEQFTKWFLLDQITHGPGLYELVHWTAFRY